MEEEQSPEASPDRIVDEISTSQRLARTSLSQFFQHGVPSTTWDVFGPMDQLRIAYVGTQVSNLSHLISLDQSSRPFLMYPHPEIHLPPPSTSMINLHRPFGHEANHRFREVSSLFTKDLRDDLVESFFAKIHPTFPVIDEPWFRLKYAGIQKPLPLLLLHAVMLVGAHVSQDPRVKDSRSLIKSMLFKRAKWLFDARHEHDRQHLVAAALLFTWHLENADTASMNSYYWSGVACRIAFGIGMHRNILSDPDTPDRMPLSDRRVYRRTWWTLFQVEVMSALEHGRPPMIHLEDFDQPPLERLDAEASDGTENAALNFRYCSRNIELCYIVLDILRLTAPGLARRGSRLDPESFHSRLADWALSLPTTVDFGSLQLQLHYHTVVLHLFRLHGWLPDFALSSLNATELCNGATRAIVSIFETMLAIKVVNQCYSTSVMALTAAAVHLSKEIQRSVTNGAILVALNLVRDLERVFPIATALSEYWPSCDGVLKVFSSLAETFKSIIANQQQPSAHQEDSDISRLNEINWEDILVYPFPQQPLDADDWMNAWPGLDE